MTSSDKFCLKWNDFQQNIRESFSELSDDQEFADITLVCEDSENIKAHKVIISASSPVFRDILKISKNSHPLIYMRGVKAKNLSYIVDFMYYGEVSIHQDELNNFLTLAEELKLKGLAETSSGENYINYASADNNYLTNRSVSKQNNYNIGTSDTVTYVPGTYNESTYQVEEKVYNITNEIVKVEDDKILMVNLPLDSLDEKIDNMLEKQGSSWTCKICGKSTEKKSNMRNHIEGIHMTGMEHPCSICGKTYRSRNSLTKHISVYHNAKNK